MKKPLVVIAFLFCFYHCFAQKPKVSHYISVEAAPVYSYRLILNMKNNNIQEKYGFDSKLLKSRLDSTEYADFGSSYALLYHFRNHKTGFTAGIEYVKFGEKTKLRLTKGYIDNNIPVYSGTEEFQFGYVYEQLTFPIYTAIRLYDRRTKIYLSLGFSLNYIFAHKIISPDNAGSLLMKPPLKEDFATYQKFTPFKLGYGGGVRFEREIFRNTSFGIEPGFFFNLIEPVLHIENELLQYNYFGRLSFSVIRKIK